jgi:CubicO group peptidase (beta-lactamase class C family)
MLTRRSLLAATGASFVTTGGFTRTAARQEQPAGIWPGDDWSVADPESLGMDRATLDNATARAVAEVPAISVLMAVRGGRIGYEQYFNGHRPEIPINIRSVTKSVTGYLAAIAADEGLFDSLDQTVGETIPDRIPAGADPNIADVTVRHLLMMASGIQWPQPGDWQALMAADDWVTTYLSQPVTGIPGQTYVYSTAGSHLLGVMIAAAAGMPLEEYAEEKIFTPLEIEAGRWERSPQGEVNGGSGLHLAARDQARFGLLSLREGRWEDRQIVPAAFVREATTWKLQGDSTGGWEGYGYQWWVTATWSGVPAYFGLGYGGQHIFVVPALDLVIIAGIAKRVGPEELRPPRPLIETIAASVIGPVLDGRLQSS